MAEQETDPADPAVAPADLPTETESIAPAPGDEPPGATSAADAEQAAIDELLKSASFEGVSPSVGGGIDVSLGDAPGAPPTPLPIDLPNLQQIMQEAQVSSIDLLRDVELNVKIELGRSRMLVEDVLRLAEGSVVELDKLAGDPVDVFVNDRLVARGEVLVLNDNFCVRVNEIVNGSRAEAP
jgi:flagellar motor switch protein FliN/FliY